MEKETVPIKQLKDFGFLFGFGFPTIIGWIMPAIGGHPFRFWSLYLGFSVVLITIFNPKVLSFPYKFWMKLGKILGWINSHLILGLIFIIVLQPTALVMKFFGYDPLRLKKTKTNSYREIRKDVTIDLKRIF